MALFDKVARPDRPEGQNTAMSEGQVMGWLPAIVTDTNDPTGLNRVKVRCDLIDPLNNLPNGIDGWLPVGQLTTGGEFGGVGTIRRVPMGAQVAIEAMMGDPTQFMVTWCIPNRFEPPNRELSNNDGFTGETTEGGTIKLLDDRTGATINATPSGLTTYSSAKGDKLVQTPGGGKSVMFSDGAISQENKKASTNISVDGDIKSSNSAGVTLGLSSKGSVELEDKMGAGLKLDGDKNATFQGTRTPLAGTVKALERLLPGLISEASQLVRAITADPFNNVLIGRLEELLGKLPEAQNLLQELSDFGTEAIGKSLLPQATAAINGGIDQLKIIAEQAIQEPDPVEYLKKELTDDQFKKIPENLTVTLNALSHDPPLQVQSIVSSLVDGGFDSIKQVIGMGVETLLPQVDRLLKTIPEIDEAIATPEEIEAWQKIVDEITANIQSQVPNLDAVDLVNKYLAGGDPFRTILGSQAQSLIADVTDLLNNDLFSGGIDNLLNQIETLPEQLNGLNAKVSQMLNSLDSSQRGGLMNLTKDSAEIKANPDGAVMRLEGDKATIKPSQTDLAPSMEVTMAQAALVGAGGASRVFADQASAGLATAFGGFSFGSAGGIMQAIGKFAQTVKTKVSDLSGSNFDLTGDSLKLSHGLPESPNHELRIDQDGIFADDVNLADLADPDRFWTLYYRDRVLTLIQENIPPTPPTP